MAGYQTAAVQATMNAPGAANGYIFVPDNSRFIPNAEAWLNHAGTITNVIITDLLGTNQIGCRIKPGPINPVAGDAGTGPYPGPNYGKSSMTSFVAGDTITMPAQFIADGVAPAIPTMALLYDTTSASGAGLDTGTIDVSNYSSLSIDIVYGGATQGTVTWYWVDDLGASLQVATYTSVANQQQGWGPGNSAPNSLSASLPRRIRITAGLVAAETVRIIVYGRK